MHIYKSYDQPSLNHQYNNRTLVPHHQQYFDLWDRLNQETNEHYHIIQNIPYGDDAREVLDFYPAEGNDGATMIFIHGGYWQMMTKDDFQFIAQAFVPLGIQTVIIEYPIAPQAKMDSIVASVRKAMTWVHDHITIYSGNPDQLYLCGHSAGGHLASMMLTKEYAPEHVHLKGVCALSGLYDLIPIQLSHVNEPLGMDKETAIRCSPIQYSFNQTPCILAVGGDESDEYHAQMTDLFKKWSLPHQSLSYMMLPGVNHFSILSELLDEHSDLKKKIIQMMKEDHHAIST